MLKFIEERKVESSLEVSNHFATFLYEDETSYYFNISFSILQSEISKNLLEKVKIKVYNSNVTIDPATFAQTSLPSKIKPSIEKKSLGISKVLEKDIELRRSSKSKKDSLIAEVEVGLLDAVDKSVLTNIKIGNVVSDIKSLLKTRPVLKEEYNKSPRVSPQQSNLKSNDIRYQNIKILNTLKVDPSEAIFQKDLQSNSLVSNLRDFYLTAALDSLTKENVYLVPVNSSVFVDRKYFQKQIKIKKELSKASDLTFSFELYQLGKNVTFSLPQKRSINVFKHISLSNVIKNAPVASPSYAFLGKLTSISFTQKDNLADAIEVRKKTINSIAECSSYSKIGFFNLKNNFSDSFVASDSPSQLLIYRFIPQSSNMLASAGFVFKNIVAGSSIEIDTTGIVITDDQSASAVNIEVVNPPEDAIKYKIEKRKLVGGSSTEFVTVKDFSDLKERDKRVQDKNVFSGEVYEYVVKYISSGNRNSKSVSKLHKYINNSLGKTLAVSVSDVSLSAVDGRPSVSFSILGTTIDGEANVIKAALEQANIYQEFSTDFENIKDQFQDIIFYKVSRTNLSKSPAEKEEFRDVLNGPVANFVDNFETQKNSGVLALDPSASYKYEIRAYFKNPLTLLRDYVHKGTTSIKVGEKTVNKPYKYRPYKWLQPKTRFSGTLSAEDENGNLLVPTLIEDGDAGVVAATTVSGLDKILKIDDFSAERVDINKVLLKWSLTERQEEYDHFVIVKEVNQKRNIIASVYYPEYVDSITTKDFGTVIYYVIPVLNEYSIGQASRSNAVIIDPEEFYGQLASISF
jgi:hypothetical protein